MLKKLHSDNATINMLSCDVLVHPGLQETFGLVVLEAMACGLPVVGMASGGVAELVDDKTGILVKPGSMEDLAQGIRHVYKKGIAELGRNARRKVVQQYDWDHIMPQLMAQYVSLIASRGQRAASSPAEASFVNH
jgi:alpha-1,6-mannosyltransferase